MLLLLLKFGEVPLALIETGLGLSQASLFTSMGWSIASSIARQPLSKLDRPPALAWRAQCSLITVSTNEFQSVQDL
jgi:hypothetical protein